MNKRFNIFIISISILFCIIILRLVYLFVFSNDLMSFKSSKFSYLKSGSIEDSNGNILAYSLPKYNLYVNPKKIISQFDREVLGELIDLTKVDTTYVAKKINKNKVFLLKRFFDKEKINDIYNLKANFLLIDKVYQRIYPNKDLLSHVIGFAGFDGIGLSGIEFSYRNKLSYTNLTKVSESIKIKLNIDRDLQQSIEKQLEKTVKESEAKSGVAIVLEVLTGKVVVMANYPTFDLNYFYKESPEMFRSQAVSELVEPGSIFKAFAVAYLIEYKKVNPYEKRYFCQGDYKLSNGEIIKSTGVHGRVSLKDVLKYSCNSGIIQAMEDVSKDEFYNFLKMFGLGGKTKIDLPGEIKSILPEPKDWGIRTKATIPMGHGIALSPLHILSAFSALVGDGYLYSPRIVDSISFYEGEEMIEKEAVNPQLIGKVLSEETSRKMVDLLVYGTVKGSTGYLSRKSGLKEVFGKTSTSQRVNLQKGGYYKDRYHSLFAGGYPKSAPKYTIIVLMTEPKNDHSGGRVAAPFFSKVVEEIARAYHLTDERVVEKRDNIDFAKVKSSTNLVVFNELSKNMFDNRLKKIPNFKGLSLRKTMVLLFDFISNQKVKGIKVNYKIYGSGFVYKQIPLAGKSIKNEEVIEIFFK